MLPIEKLISERPSFHSSETEVSRRFEWSESFLPEPTARRLAVGDLTCYAIGSDVLRFIADAVGENSRSLETGAGCSTLVFALRRSVHTAVTPSQTEIKRIQEYAEEQSIPLDTVQFIAESSDRYLPRASIANLDLVLLDGKHAFPWPFIDWFYTADRLRRGGIMLIDDVPMRSVGVLAEFMHADPAWEFIRNFSGKTLAFKKVRDSAHDVAWHMQPWTVSQPGRENRSLASRIAVSLKRVIAEFRNKASRTTVL